MCIYIYVYIYIYMCVCDDICTVATNGIMPHGTNQLWFHCCNVVANAATTKSPGDGRFSCRLRFERGDVIGNVMCSEVTGDATHEYN